MRYVILLAFLLALAPFRLQAQAGDGRIYVRRIEFLGTGQIDDSVLRRELTQLEGAHINTVELERSRVRLERLPYIERARISKRPVKGAPDQVDVLITITEALARQYGIGGAYSESQRVSGYGYFINENLFGTGQRFFAQVEASEFYTAAQLSHTDYFVRSNGVSRTTAIAFRRFDQLTADTTELKGDLVRGQLAYSYQVAERQAIRLGVALQDAGLTTGLLASSQIENWVRNNGRSFSQGNEFSTDYLIGEFLFGWHHDTRDKKVFPDMGAEHLFSLKIAIPGSQVEYYTLDYEFGKYWPLSSGWTAKIAAKLGFGAKYGSKTSSLPPNLNWFAGGPSSVRGYRESRLGPKDSLRNPYGGNLFLSSQFELMMPLPKKWQKNTRIGFFYDIGNVFSTENIRFQDDEGQSLDYTFKASELRQSVGIAAQILFPLGLMRVSYGIPLNATDDNPNRFLRDDIERFQITFGIEF